MASDANGYSFVLFLYNKIEWTSSQTCNGTGGTAGAKAGFDAGDGVNYYLIDGSCSPKIMTVQDRSNVGVPGLWVFRVDGKAIEHPQVTIPVSDLPTDWDPTVESTTDYNPLSDADGTPCGCNKTTLWLDIILAIDKSSSVGTGGVGAVGLFIIENIFIDWRTIGHVLIWCEYRTRWGAILYSCRCDTLC